VHGDSAEKGRPANGCHETGPVWLPGGPRSKGPLTDELMKKLEQHRTPKAVEEIVRTLGHDLREPQRRRFKQDLLLSYYYGGKEVACRETKSGLEIVSFGRNDEVAKVLDSLEIGEAEGIVVVYPPVFDTWVREMKPRASGRTR
jgi:hypothetical protein